MELVFVFIIIIFFGLIFDSDSSTTSIDGTGLISGSQKYCCGSKIHAVYLSDNVVRYSLSDFCSDKFMYLNIIIQHACSMNKFGCSFIVLNDTVTVTYCKKSQADQSVKELCRIT